VGQFPIVRQLGVITVELESMVLCSSTNMEKSQHAQVAVALFQTGKTPEALKTVEAAISKLTRVQTDETFLFGIRDDAARALQQAQTILARLKSTE
jgi:hypothetical protein